MRDECLHALEALTGKRKIYFTQRGNASIHSSLKFAKEHGKVRMLIQDQGGWLKYLPIGEELGFHVEKVRTNLGMLSPTLLSDLDDRSVVLWNSAPGYYAFEGKMQELHELCSKKGATLINDISGSVGNKCSLHGDILIGSFGRWKPIWLERGGFVASDLELPVEEHEFAQDFFISLQDKLLNLNTRVEYLLKQSSMVKQDLKGHNLIKGDGFNVIVRFNNDQEKHVIISYCESKGLEYTICPREIRVLEQAISIEIKRLRE